MSKGKKVTIGYRYRLGFHLVLCQGGADAIIRIRYEDREAWTGNVTTNQTITINKPELFGGDKKQGGLQGDIDFMFGGESQAVNSYLAYHSNKSVIPSYLSQYDFQGGSGGWTTATGGTNSDLVTNGGVAVPAYRGVVSMVFKKFMYGAMNPYLKPFRITVRRIPKTLGATNATITIKGRQNANPAHMIYDILTNKQWGQGLESGDLNSTSFTTAAATLASEGLGLSLLWKQEGTADDFINLILSHINATLYPDPSTGQYTLKLLRADYTPATLTTLDETNILSLRSFQRTSTNDLTNELTVEYYDPDNEQDAKITVQNLAALRSVGKVVRRVIQYPGIRDGDLAARVAQRDLLAFSTPLAKLSIEANLTAWNLRPGDVFKFSWAKLGITSVIFRVVEIEYGALRDNKVTINAVEDIFGVPSASYIGTQAPLWQTVPTSLSDITNYKLFDTPYYSLIQYFGEEYATTLADNRNFVSVVAPRANGLWSDYKLNELVSGSYIERDTGSFSPFVSLANNITQTDTSVTYTGYFDLELVVVGSLGVIDNEWVVVDAINTTTKTLTLKRGVLDSVPETHAANTLMYLYGENYLLDEDTDRYATESVTYKFQPSAGGEELALASATARAYTVNGRQQRPYPPGNVKINAQYFPTSVIDDVAVTWAHRNRLTQTAAPISWTSGSVSTEAGVTYTITFYRAASATVVYTTTGQTGTSFTATDVELGEENDLRLEIKSVRSSIDNFQTFSHRFIRETTKDEYAQRVFIDLAIGFWRLGDSTSSTFVFDSSSNSRNGTAVNGVTFQTTALTIASNKNKAATFNGTNNYVTVPYVSALAPTAAVTVESWFSFNAFPSSTAASLISKTEGGGYNLSFNNQSTVGIPNVLSFIVRRNGVYGFAYYSTALNLNETYHAVGTYDGRYARLYIDGVLVSTNDAGGNFPITYAQNNSLIIGAEAGTGTTPSGEYFNGTLDEVSVYDSSLSSDVVLARYRTGTGRVTYREDPFWDKVVCSLHMNGTASSTTFTDSKGATTWTAFGNANISTTQSKFGGAAAFFDGAGDYITTPYVTSTMNWWTGYFTIEAWVYPTSLTNWGTASLSRMLGNMDPTGGTNNWSFGPNSSGNVVFYYWTGSGNTVTSSTTISINTWSHIAVVVANSKINIYINGVNSASAEISGTPAASASFPLTVGQYSNTSIAGYIDDLRITRAARYLKTFFPPVEQFPDRQCVPETQDPFWPETVMLMHMNGTNGSTTFTDVIGKTVTASGNAQISTAQSKFGGASVLFDGAGDYLSIPDSADFDFAAGNFTVEMWVYPTSSTSQRFLFGQHDGTGSLYSPLRIEINSGNYSFLLSQTGSSWTSGTVITAPVTINSWAHIAVVRYQNVVTLYLNGVARGTRTLTAALFNSTYPLLIGASPAGTYSFAGYIDELRITKGAARYTRDFAPPKAPFPETGIA